MATGKRVCLYCGQKFELTLDNYVMVGRRYAHKGCRERFIQNGSKPISNPQTYICPYCSQEVNAKNSISVMHNRYAHKECYEKFYNKDDDEIDGIYQVLNKYGIEYQYFKCEKQRTQFISQGMTNSGIKKTLDYFYGVKNGDKTKAQGGIGIVPYVYEEAKNWYRNKTQIKEVAERSLEKLEEEKIIVTKINKSNKVKSFYDIEDFNK